MLLLLRLLLLLLRMLLLLQLLQLLLLLLRRLLLLLLLRLLITTTETVIIATATVLLLLQLLLLPFQKPLPLLRLLLPPPLPPTLPSPLPLPNRKAMYTAHFMHPMQAVSSRITGSRQTTGKPSARQSTVGVIDMGGGSLQIAFEVDRVSDLYSLSYALPCLDWWAQVLQYILLFILCKLFLMLFSRNTDFVMSLKI